MQYIALAAHKPYKVVSVEEHTSGFGLGRMSRPTAARTTRSSARNQASSCWAATETTEVYEKLLPQNLRPEDVVVAFDTGRRFSGRLRNKSSTTLAARNMIPTAIRNVVKRNPRLGFR